MSSQEARMQSQLLAKAVAAHRDAVAKLAPLGGRDVLDAARRQLREEPAPADRPPR